MILISSSERTAKEIRYESVERHKFNKQKHQFFSKGLVEDEHVMMKLMD